MMQRLTAQTSARPWGFHSSHVFGLALLEASGQQPLIWEGRFERFNYLQTLNDRGGGEGGNGFQMGDV